MKEKIISEIKELELAKLKKNFKKLDHIKCIEDKHIQTDVSALCYIVAKLENNTIKFYYKNWIHDFRGYGGNSERDVKYEECDLKKLSLESLEKLLVQIKNSDTVL